MVGYGAADTGADAVALAVAIARAQSASLDIVHVRRRSEPFNPSYPEQDPGAERGGRPSPRTLLERARSLVPDDVEARTHTRTASSFAEGLMTVAQQFDAELIIVGAASSGLWSRFSVGTVADHLLHSSPVPVALAPRGYDAPRITRISAAIGSRPGAQAVLDTGLAAAARRRVRLRLISLLALGNVKDRPEARRHTQRMLDEAAHTLPAAARVDTAIATGKTIENAIDRMTWEPGDLVLVGSSRLAHGNRLFMGSTASKMLRTLPVPMIVVPKSAAALAADAVADAAADVADAAGADSTGSQRRS
ncbi:hypothetical protein BGP79_00485 [Tersicoccus sp. Bi-70]|nr:hypothetical protein BGP79_00485 [Tersicoccus sp. Bi-70]